MNDITQQFAPEDIQKNKVISALSYLGILFFLPLVAAPESRFGKFHANQSLVLMLAGFAGAVALGGDHPDPVFGVRIGAYRVRNFRACLCAARQGDGIAAGEQD